MLELHGITKVYAAGELRVHALRGVDMAFRKAEFVSILGPSGCGKTTLLNIIGGLDRYTEGDLRINGRSTKEFRDRDWDSYRNHSVGFVFQSYNLIPHQSVLQNVELALTLSGVSKKERRKRAKEALVRVGLGDQFKKKPSEMSGGQMQRVAIARAIVNNPDIILADEPTGALDTETSVQVMEILKEIAKDRLVVMVTHNPDLAETYSTRIIRMVDGKVTSDTMPLTDAEINAEKEQEKALIRPKKAEKKPSMSLLTSFGLSLKNLFTKKGRTMLTSFAGSIGIIGIALIYAVSQGATTYINLVQEEALTAYPLTLQAQTMDLSSLMETFIGNAESFGDHENDAVYQKAMVYHLVNALAKVETSKNDLAAFKKHIETAIKNGDSISDALTGLQYSYDLDLLVYTENVDGEIIPSDSRSLMQDMLLEVMGMELSASLSGGASGMMSMGGSGSSTWEELMPGKNGELVNDVVKKQYDIIHGAWPTAYNEVVLVVDSNNELDDMALYALGLKSEQEIRDLMNAAMNQTELEYEQKSWSYEEICGMEFKIVLNTSCYTKDEHSGLYFDLRDTSAGLKYLYDNGIPMKVSGIIRPNPDASASTIGGTIAYTNALTARVVEEIRNDEIIADQLKSPDVDIFTGLPFPENVSNMTDEEKETAFREYIDLLDEKGKANAYVTIMSIPKDEDVDKFVKAQLAAAGGREKIEQTMLMVLVSQTGMKESELSDYLSAMKDEDIEEMYAMVLTEQYKAMYAAQVQGKLNAVPQAQKVLLLNQLLDGFTAADCARYYEHVLVFSESSLESNLRRLGYVDLNDPSSIRLYASTFENKDVIEAFIKDYNDTVDELSEIRYTDYIGIMMASITTIINAITYVLISFVAVSLVVSSIMIGVITLISVQERTKEIGILRAIGASKRNVSSMFTAETVIIGFASGLLGVLVTYGLCIPINIILVALTGIPNLRAILPIEVAVTLIVISMLLTLIAGIIPSRSAARKDPVVALRTE
ncbi:MAG: ABC transporter ATP-binding protein/permease [Ruminococcaceae bacterium]|nr:ABC transporter ATP-binding protein/permease [Oscillospiraceae bacterium]